MEEQGGIEMPRVDRQGMEEQGGIEMPRIEVLPQGKIETQEK